MSVALSGCGPSVRSITGSGPTTPGELSSQNGVNSGEGEEGEARGAVAAPAPPAALSLPPLPSANFSQLPDGSQVCRVYRPDVAQGRVCLHLDTPHSEAAHQLLLAWITEALGGAHEILPERAGGPFICLASSEPEVALAELSALLANLPEAAFYRTRAAALISFDRRLAQREFALSLYAEGVARGETLTPEASARQLTTRALKHVLEKPETGVLFEVWSPEPAETSRKADGLSAAQPSPAAGVPSGSTAASPQGNEPGVPTLQPQAGRSFAELVFVPHAATDRAALLVILQTIKSRAGRATAPPILLKESSNGAVHLSWNGAPEEVVRVASSLLSESERIVSLTGGLSSSEIAQARMATLTQLASDPRCDKSGETHFDGKMPVLALKRALGPGLSFSGPEGDLLIELHRQKLVPEVRVLRSKGEESVRLDGPAPHTPEAPSEEQPVDEL